MNQGTACVQLQQVASGDEANPIVAGLSIEKQLLKRLGGQHLIEPCVEKVDTLRCLDPLSHGSRDLAKFILQQPQ
jgi:hypothetical protein